VGRLDRPPRDLSAGAWRAVVFGAPGTWPPSEGWRERRKFLLEADGRVWLARFAGLGEDGEAALSRAQTLAEAGLVPAPAGLRHGFLVQRFEAASPLPLARVARARVVRAVARHLAFVAERFPAREGEGASPRALAAVAAENAGALLGAAAGSDAAALAARHLPEVERRARPVEIDGRLQRWEWLVLPAGALLKADALDHHRDHALVGCQDALWDVAGAATELGLCPGETAAVARAVRSAAPGAPPRCLPFYALAYAAFEAGRWTLSAQEAGADPGERERRRAQAGRLVAALRRVLRAGPAGRVGPGGTSPGAIHGA
jgi:hypothetical protein